MEEYEKADDLKYDTSREASRQQSHATAEQPLSKTQSAAASIKNKLRLYSIRSTGPFKHLRPTNDRLGFKFRGSQDSHDHELTVYLRSRDRRKGRQSVAVPSSMLRDENEFPLFKKSLRPTRRLSAIYERTGRLFTKFPYYDMAFWVAFWSAVGSLFWLLNGLFAWLPVAFPGTAFPGEADYVAGYTALVATFTYQIGAVMAYLETINGCFQGSAMKKMMDACGDVQIHQKQLFDEKLKGYIRSLRPNRNEAKDPANVSRISEEQTKYLESEYAEVFSSISRRGALDYGVESEPIEHMPFRWFPTFRSLRTRHIREIGFLACAIQLIGATIYIINGIVGVPGIMDSLTTWQKNITYWVPEIIASLAFVVSGTLFSLETQSRWYKPAPKVLGWWIGLWGFLGAIGFVLCGALGPATYNNSGANYQALLSSTWGSICFLINSVLMWYEAVNKYSVEVLHDGLD